VKKFYDDWNDQDVSDFLSQTPVLVLFKLHYGANEAELIIHGKLNEKQKMLLKVCIVGEFGGMNMTNDISIEINEYAKRWYNDYILAPKKIRVLNFSKGRG
jgi:hypothetical protein